MVKNSTRILFFTFYMLSSVTLYGQRHPDLKMLHDIPTDSSFNGDIFNRWFVSRGMMFWPEDLDYARRRRDYEYRDHILKTKNGLFLAIETTGRLYQVKFNKKDSVTLIRLDSTLHGGYNHNAFYFTHHDTLFSLGGYGLWHFNGHLRYYIPSHHGWELLPVNKKVPAIDWNRGSYMDQKTGTFYYLSQTTNYQAPYYDQGVFRNVQKEKANNEGDKIYALNLSTRIWDELGVLTKITTDHLKHTSSLGELPWGLLKYELFQDIPQKFNVYLYDFRGNQIKNLRDQGKLLKIYELIQVRSEPSRIISFYHDGALTIITSDDRKIKIPLSPDDFEKSGPEIYSYIDLLIQEINTTAVILFVLLLVTVAGLYFSLRKKIKIEFMDSDASENPFDKEETTLIQKFILNPALSVDEIDLLLGTDKKNKDTQSKKRGNIVKSINAKYTLVTGDPAPLINTKRMELDKRMFQYIFEKEKMDKILRFL